ncbi:MAG: hypothetical protein J3K34DRAFT_151407 [Monoraphidium minutum]|nr:MAG: hypothetical protein J3K34DRAFT_151407 [Monoraphidium minutum]
MRAAAGAPMADATQLKRNGRGPGALGKATAPHGVHPRIAQVGASLLPASLRPGGAPPGSAGAALQKQSARAARAGAGKGVRGGAKGGASRDCSDLLVVSSQTGCGGWARASINANGGRFRREAAAARPSSGGGPCLTPLRLPACRRLRGAGGRPAASRGCGHRWWPAGGKPEGAMGGARARTRSRGGHWELYSPRVQRERRHLSAALAGGKASRSGPAPGPVTGAKALEGVPKRECAGTCRALPAPAGDETEPAAGAAQMGAGAAPHASWMRQTMEAGCEQSLGDTLRSLWHASKHCCGAGGAGGVHEGWRVAGM